MCELTIRREKADEYRRLEEITREAFWNIYQPGCVEHFLLHELRKDESFLPELSFLAEKDGKLIGGIYFSKAVIETPNGSFPVLSFGPLAVLPEFQKNGIGAALIKHSVECARNAGYAAIGIYGNPVYYSRFGFESAQKYLITDGGGDFCDALQVLELKKGSLIGHGGRFNQAAVFHIDPMQAANFDKTFPPKKKEANPMQIFLGTGTIGPVSDADFEDIYEIVNDAASAYKGIIPADRWHEPYMSREELCGQMKDGVKFYAYYVNSYPVGVMGIQDKGEVELIRHAYVRSACRKFGIGGRLLKYLHEISSKPMLIGTWADASWAISFYRKHGFNIIAETERKNALLRKFWKIPERQVETSVVLTDGKI